MTFIAHTPHGDFQIVAKNKAEAEKLAKVVGGKLQ